MAATTASLLTAAAGLAGSIQQSQAIRDQGRFASQQARFNARMAELQAEDALRRGERAAGQQRAQTRRLVGRQRAAIGAQGVALDAGSALEVVADTEALGALDEFTIRNNAFREAFGFRAQAGAFRTEGRFARLGARTQARSTLLAGGLQAARDFQNTQSYLQNARRTANQAQADRTIRTTADAFNRFRF